MERGGYQRSKYLQCQCPQEGKFQSSYVVWSNGHGECLRYFCPSHCGHFVDVECMKKTNYEPRVIRSEYMKQRCCVCGKYFPANLMKHFENNGGWIDIKWICETCQGEK